MQPGTPKVSQRMRHLASQLSVIKISLDPPSPPLIIAGEFEDSGPQTPPAEGDLIPSFASEYANRIANSNLLQVPRYDIDECERQCSPPPRRFSQTSTLSDNSSVYICLNSSYQNLLNPDAKRWRNRSASTVCDSSFSDDTDTPPNEMVFLVPPRPRSAQSTPADSISPTVLLSPVLCRPVRSQSAHSSQLLRNPAGVSDSDSETPGLSSSRPGSGIWSHATVYRQGSRNSRPSDSSSPLATPPTQHGSPSGSFRTTRSQRDSLLYRCGSPLVGSFGGSGNFPPGPSTSRASPTPYGRSLSHRHSHQDSFDGHFSSGSSHLAAPGVRSSAPVPDAFLDSGSLGDPGGSIPRPPSRSLLNEHHLNRIRRMRRRPSAATASSSGASLRPHLDSLGHQASFDCSLSPGGGLGSSGHRTGGSLVRMRNLGHSDPQIYTFTPAGGSPAVSRGGNARRSVLLSGCPLISGRLSKKESSLSPKLRLGRRSDAFLGPSSSSGAPPGQAINLSPSANSAGTSHSLSPAGPSGQHRHRRHHHPRSSISAASGANRRQAGQVVMRAASSLAAPAHADNRRWSVASLPSSSGYGTPGSNSAFSSQYSSQEHLADYLNELRMNPRFDSNDSYDDTVIFQRPRSRSLASPVRMMTIDGTVDAPPAMASLYKERFPKAKAQMESRLQQFLIDNSPLSGFTTSIALDVRSQSPQSPVTVPRAVSPKPGLNKTPSGSLRLRHGGGRSSPRPTSPLPRPISPLCTESVTATPQGVVYRSSSTNKLSSSTTLAAVSPTASHSFVLPSSSGGYGNSLGGSSGSRGAPPGSTAVSVTETLLQADPRLLQLLADGATRFLHHQICEVAADCLQRSRDDLLTCAYFCDMSNRLEETLLEAQAKCGPDSCRYLSKVTKQLLMTVSRTARLLECLEFDPDEFYQLLEEAEGAVRYHLGSGTARVPDLPQYIIDKLGLNKQLLTEDAELSPDEETAPRGPGGVPTINRPMEGVKLRQKGCPTSLAVDRRESGVASSGGNSEKESEVTADTRDPLEVLRSSLATQAPKEEDFETIRLISNGAYGAVYLVRHKQTRLRFALKKMKKQTLILRNQVDQVYAERDILTFTDNPFVVCFYGSFETKQHLCMLMEYVEGGDCASLLKSAVVLPLELTRLYVAETILAIEYLHSCGIVHRDLKPDNLLITAMGHIKLTDFGLSKIGLMNRTTLVSEGYLDDTQQFKDNQLCGTPEYIAPEVILRQGYGKPVDWWALGVIIYEFLVGIVPFLGDTPEALFANIINEDIEFPDDEEEGFDTDAEDLIRHLLEKNPFERLGTASGAAELTVHPFFATLDFDSLLRQKAEFVPQLENDEDTSYFDSRSERYNHDADSGDDESVPMFWSFSTASPRHSIIGLEISPAQVATLNAAAAAAASSSTLTPSSAGPTGGPPLDFVRKYGGPVTAHGSISDDGGAGTPSTGTGSGSHSAFSVKTGPARLSDSTDSQYFFDSNRLPPSSGSVGTKSLEGDYPSSTAVLLRRRFSSQRGNNYSTSSSGTNGTGCFNTGYSSTDSSMDASSFHVDSPTVTGPARRPLSSHSPLPRFAISSPSDQQPRVSPTMRLPSRGDETTISCSGPGVSELSPVQEKSSNSPFGPLSEANSRAGSAMDGSVSTEAVTPAKSPIDHPGESLKVQIPSGISTAGPSSASSSASPSAPVQVPQVTGPSSSTVTSYYHAYPPSSSTGQLSPSCNSVSSASSVETALPAASVKSRPPSTSENPTQSKSYLASGSSALSKPPIVIKKGHNGFGFTVKCVRVYLSENSDYYTIEHIVEHVVEKSPAAKSGLKEKDIITHVCRQPVNNMTHPQLMHRLLSCGNELSLHVTPLTQSTIKEGEARRVVGKLLRKKPHHKPQRRIPLDKKPRKGSALLRRLSGKHGPSEFVPGTSSQKQAFIPRSVSSQDGVPLTTGLPVIGTGALGLSQPSPKGKIVPQLPTVTSAAAKVSSKIVKPIAVNPAQKRRSDVGLAPLTDLPPLKVPELAKSPLAFEKKEKKQPPPIPPPPRRASHAAVEETRIPSSPQRTSAFQELKNTIVQRFSPSAHHSTTTGHSAATAGHSTKHAEPLSPSMGPSSSSTGPTSSSTGPSSSSTGHTTAPHGLPHVHTHGPHGLNSASAQRRNSAGIAVSPLARSSAAPGKPTMTPAASTMAAPHAVATTTTIAQCHHATLSPQAEAGEDASEKLGHHRSSGGPSRKLSPSRIVQRIWKGATGGNSSSHASSSDPHPSSSPPKSDQSQQSKL